MHRIRTIFQEWAFLSFLALGGLLLEAAPLQAQPSAVRQPQADGVVNINTASAGELQRLPGIGASKAQAILQLRQRIQRFRQVEDLLHVPGIGRRTLLRLRPLLTVTGPTTLGTAQTPQF